MSNNVLVYSGTIFNLDEPKADDVHIKDIAHHLSLICRFNGGTDEFYSVAEHSLLVAHHLEWHKHPAEVVLHGLLHDAHETYVGDITTPVKRMLGAAYGRLRQRLDAAISERIGFDVDTPRGSEVWKSDQVLLTVEAWHLMVDAGEGEHWSHLVKVDPFTKAMLRPRKLAAPDAEREFLEKYNSLLTQLHKERGGRMSASYAV